MDRAWPFAPERTGGSFATVGSASTLPFDHERLTFSNYERATYQKRLTDVVICVT